MGVSKWRKIRERETIVLAVLTAELKLYLI